jgi:molybdate transport system substrate-binding protein
MEWLCRATSAALMLCLAQSAGAAEIKVLCIPGMKAALEALLPQFERDAGHKVAIHYEIYAGQKGQIESGDFDVAIFATSQIEQMTKEGRTVAGSVTDIARTSIGIAVQQGAPKPDISSEEAFKRTLVAAKSITYTKQSSTGVYLTQLLERLGIAAVIKDKLQLQPGGAMTTPAVAKGEAELGIVLISDILATPGVDLVGPLPEALQNHVMQTAALSSTAKQPAAAAALIKFLSSPAAGSVFKAKGLDPPPR